MTAVPGTTVGDRIMQVLGHLGVRRAHFAGRGPDEWESMARSFPEAMTSLTLVCPDRGDRSLLGTLGPRAAVLNGDGPRAEAVERLMGWIVGLIHVHLFGYEVAG